MPSLSPQGKQRWVIMSITKSEEWDLVVVGHGIAGLSAAVSAAEASGKVIVVERAPFGDHGGNTRWTDALMRLKSEEAVADDFEDHFARNAGHHLDPLVTADLARDFEDQPRILRTLGITDPEVISEFADAVPSTIAWLKGHGVVFDFQPTYFITTCTPRMGPTGGGLALVEALTAAAVNLGIEIRYETAAHRIVDDGVEVVGPRSQTEVIHGRSVMLACGGFEGNPAMLAQYLGPTAKYVRPVARGGYYNKGEGIQMGLEQGAATAGDFSAIHAEPLDPRSGREEPIVLVFNYGVLVNKDGMRFVDEAPATVDATYEAITRVIQTQPGGIAWAVFDSRIEDVPNWRVSVRSDQPPIEAPTLEALAAACGLDGEGLILEIEAFNASCPDASGFKPLELDGLRASPANQPRKSNWSRSIGAPPYFAFPIITGNCFTFGGLRCDAKARVINIQGDPIPGLYAAGETMGLYHGTYTGATSVLRGAVFGRIGGRHAVGAN
ncbi:MAG: FAD-dependent oxidoreductase [Pseudomonadota bacterium]